MDEMGLEKVRAFLDELPADDPAAITARRHLEDLEFVLAQLTPLSQDDGGPVTTHE